MMVQLNEPTNETPISMSEIFEKRSKTLKGLNDLEQMFGLGAKPTLDNFKSLSPMSGMIFEKRGGKGGKREWTFFYKDTDQSLKMIQFRAEDLSGIIDGEINEFQVQKEIMRHIGEDAVLMTDLANRPMERQFKDLVINATRDSFNLSSY